jgi:hypothetical protein
MLTILPQQMWAFSPLADELFVKHVVDHLREHYGDTMVQLSSDILTVNRIAENDLKAMVGRAISKARSYGLSNESSLAGFVALMFEAAPNFDQHPALQQILLDKTIDGNARVEQLLAHFTGEIWQVVKTNYDRHAWTEVGAAEKAHT